VRILIANAHGDDASSGGAEKVVRDLGQGLEARDVEVSLLQSFPSREPAGSFERIVLHGNDWRDDRARRVRNHLGDLVSRPQGALDEALGSAAPDLVHTHNLPGMSTAIWEAARRRGIPVVHTLHDYWLLCPRTTLTKQDATPCRPSPFLCGARTRRLARWASTVSHLIGVSQWAIDLHAGLFPAATAHLIRHPLAADPEGSPPSEPTPATLGYIGSLERIKGVHLLLEAAPRLAGLGVRLRLAGRGALEDQVAQAVANSDNVAWEGAVQGEEKRRFFAGCDLGIVPSVWAEPGGPTYTMVEWLAARRPVLVSTRGGLGEVAGVYGGSAALEPSADALVAAVSDLLEPGRWQDLLAGLRPADSAAEAEQWVDRHLAVYRSALAGPG
jgi:glycosyltransferase involved in cell wall biosynthesis